MITFYSADYVFPVSSPPWPNGVVAVNEDGTIHGVYESSDERIQNKTIVRLSGALVPGFVNAHCHLELSHMKGKAPSGEGLPAFLSAVMTERQADPKVITEAMVEADKQMYARGIQAVGDHVNTVASADVKRNSPIHYHTFVETLGMGEEVNVWEKIDEARDVEFEFDQAHSSITLHAPYSCSKSLFKAFTAAIDVGNTLSIHNQESDEENKLFRYLKGDFIAFYARHGIKVDSFKAQGRNSLQSYIGLLPTANRLLLIHNTYTSMRDLDFVARTEKNVYYCLCPKSNFYVEGKLPRFSNFVLTKQKIVLGTDSLASNDTLDILEEMKVVQEDSSDIDLQTMLRWATLNGAEALGLDNEIGSLEVGKKPGLLLLENLKELRLTKATSVKRIV